MAEPPAGGSTAVPCQVWWIRLGSIPSDPFVAWLNPDERARHAKYRRPADAERFVLGAAMARAAIGQAIGVPAATVELDRSCPGCGGPHGPVRAVAEGAPWLSVTHAGDFVGLAACTVGMIGLDTEPTVRRSSTPPSELTIALSETEAEIIAATPQPVRDRAFLRLWTRKEAAAKAVGTGLSVPVSKIVVSAPDAPPRLLSWPSSHADAGWLPGAMVMADIEPAPDYLGAVAVIAKGAGDVLEVSQADGAELLRQRSTAA